MLPAVLKGAVGRITNRKASSISAKTHLRSRLARSSVPPRPPQREFLVSFNLIQVHRITAYDLPLFVLGPFPCRHRYSGLRRSQFCKSKYSPFALYTAAVLSLRPNSHPKPPRSTTCQHARLKRHAAQTTIGTVKFLAVPCMNISFVIDLRAQLTNLEHAWFAQCPSFSG